jgi:mono/diheme cytochrome c family protein
MKRDFKATMLYLIFGLPIFLLLFIVVLYVGNCGFSTDCSQASLPEIIHTPIPTLIPATMPAAGMGQAEIDQVKCTVTARTLLSAWISSGYHETDPFQFQDANGNTCQATFSDVQPLFTEANLWYSGALACASCHHSDIATASANMDLSSYAGILAGGKRTSPDVKGEDILGGGVWDQSKLNDMLFIKQQMPFGRPPGAVAADGPTIQAGQPVSDVSVTPGAAPSGADVARPSNPGGPGEAINLTGDKNAGEQIFITYCQVCHGQKGEGGMQNPGSTDGTIPSLDPIDPTLVSPDYKTFAYNLDLFLQNGSIPAGDSPVNQMPAWGATKVLSQQQIADVIAYIISLNQ